MSTPGPSSRIARFLRTYRWWLLALLVAAALGLAMLIREWTAPLAFFYAGIF